MEKDELLSASAKQILVVSTILKNQLLDLYPELASKKNKHRASEFIPYQQLE